MSGFEPFEPTHRGGAAIGSVEDPKVTITKEGVYLGVVVWREILDETNALAYQVDTENARVGFKPAESNAAPNAYSISEYQARAAPVWDAIGAVVDESERIPLDTESEEFPVADLSRFVPDDGSSNSESADETGEGADAAESAGGGVERLAKDDLYDALDAFEVPQSVSVGDFVQAIDGERGYYDAAKRLDVDRQTVVELVEYLGVRDALENEEGALARGLALDQEELA